ncbi:hypothetical protein KSP40_PGU005531 [Platanthera guangdongensis]|uniref:Uncharacterized protein n=1 Tax=Platanthera guangdongensis TaxID=2320717 RepID=A0ABR2LXJ8_9ASPA
MMDSTRSFTKEVRRIIIKVDVILPVGTAVVSRADGRLAVGRIGALCEQVWSSMSEDFADLQKPQFELDGKASAAVGQGGLMALYDTLFSQACLQISIDD